MTKEKLSKAQRDALLLEAFKPEQVHPRTIEFLLKRGYIDRDGVGGMMKSANMQGRGSHVSPLTYVCTDAGRAALSRAAGEVA